MKSSKTIISFYDNYISIKSDLVNGFTEEEVQYLGTERGVEVYKDKNDYIYMLNRNNYTFCIVYDNGDTFFFSR